MIFRFVAIALLIALAWWAFSRIAPAVSRDPRLRGILAGTGLMALRAWLSRGGGSTLWAALKALRFFR